MPEAVDHLAVLTGFRDRDVVDVTLAAALKDLLTPLSVAIYRCVGDAGDERWLTRAKLASNDIAATSDPAWADPKSLPRLEDFPLRVNALRQKTAQTQTLSGPVHVSTFPLGNDQDVLAVLEVESDGPISAQAQRLLGSILRIYRNFQSLLDYSERDTLTGLLNRKTFDQTFMKTASSLGLGNAIPEFPLCVEARALDADRRPSDVPCRDWLGLIDIDHFKRVNDRYGHLMGDEVLLLISRVLRSSFRTDDRLYRFGGEEFVVLMRCGTEAHAAHALQRLCSNVRQYPFPRVGTITVSVGFTEIQPGDTPHLAFERADRALFHAKNNGRDLVHSYAELLAAGQAGARDSSDNMECV